MEKEVVVTKLVISSAKGSCRSKARREMDPNYNNKKYLQTVNAADYYRTMRPSVSLMYSQLIRKKLDFIVETRLIYTMSMICKTIETRFVNYTNFRTELVLFSSVFGKSESQLLFLKKSLKFRFVFKFFLQIIL